MSSKILIEFEKVLQVVMTVLKVSIPTRSISRRKLNTHPIKESSMYKQRANHIWMKISICVAIFASINCVFAQTNFPQKPVSLVVPYPAGASVDAVARYIAEQLGNRLGQPVVVDNRGGANGAIAMEYVAKAPADGYTLIMALDSQLSINPNLYSAIRYDPVKDFAPIMLVATAPYVLFTNPQTGIKSVSDLIATARKPGKTINYTSSGVGSGGHLAAALLEGDSKVDMTHIPNKVTANALRDVAENECQFLFITYASGKPLVDSGKLIPIAVSSPVRMKQLPNLPTVGETLSGFQASATGGILAPARTPAHVVEKIRAELEKIVTTPEFEKKLETFGMQSSSIGPDGYAKTISSDLAKWKKLIAERRISVN